MSKLPQAEVIFNVKDHGMKKQTLEEGEGLLFDNKKETVWRISCCDCGLVHIIKVKPCRDGIVMQFWRDERRTAQSRRRKKEKEQCQQKSS